MEAQHCQRCMRVLKGYAAIQEAIDGRLLCDSCGRNLAESLWEDARNLYPDIEGLVKRD